MNTALCAGRTYLRRAAHQNTTFHQPQQHLFSSSPKRTTFRNHRRLKPNNPRTSPPKPPRWYWPFHRPPPPGGGKIALTASLSPAAFVLLSEKDQSDGKTGEEHMLEASRAELDEYMPEFLGREGNVRRKIYYYVDTYIVEPVATGLRFLHLVFIFVPVILTVPMMWLGGRVKGKDNERSGTLWWYRFLVSSMERAGAAFIKVRHIRRCLAVVA